MSKLIIDDTTILGGRLTVKSTYHESFDKWVDLSFDYEGQDGAEEFRITPSLTQTIELRDFLNKVILEAKPKVDKSKVRLMQDPWSKIQYLVKGHIVMSYYHDHNVSIVYLHPLIKASLIVLEEDCQNEVAKNFDKYIK